MFLGLISVLLCGLSWVYWGIVMGRAPKEKIRADILLFYTVFLTTLVSVGIGLRQGVPVFGQGECLMAGSLFMGGVCNALQLYFISRAMQKGPNGLVWLIAQAGFIIPFWVGVLFYDSQCSLIRYGGFAAVLMAVVLIGLQKDSGKASGEKKGWKILAFSAFLATGGLQVLNNLPSYYPELYLSSVWRTVALNLGSTVATLSIILFQPKAGGQLITHASRGRLWLYAISINVMQLCVAYFLMYPGMDLLALHHAGAIAYPVMMGACLVGFEVYCFLVLHERRTWSQWLCILIALSGIVALSC